MKKFAIFLTLICAVAAFEEFFDSRGQCWRCYEGAPCERCSNFESNSLWPRGWSDMCFEPNCNVPENRRFLFPSRESDYYFRCVYNRNHWSFERVECRCGTLFNMRSQECVAPRNWTPYCVELISPIMMKSCETGKRIVIIGNEVEPMTDAPTGPTDPDGTSGTWSDGTTDPNASTTVSVTSTTQNPCVCVPMMPCWCNPCMNPWMMPCRSCSGCMG